VKLGFEGIPHCSDSYIKAREAKQEETGGFEKRWADDERNCLAGK